jgi:hypothetical protein
MAAYVFRIEGEKKKEKNQLNGKIILPLEQSEIKARTCRGFQLGDGGATHERWNGRLQPGLIDRRRWTCPFRDFVSCMARRVA